MTTTITGGVINGRIGLTMSCQTAANLGDPVMGGPTDYQCTAVDGTKPIIGVVTMPNVRRGTGALAGTYPQPNVPGDVTVDLFAHAVHQFTSNATNFTAGQYVAVDATGKVGLDTAAANTQRVGIALNGSSAAGTVVDVACQV